MKRILKIMKSATEADRMDIINEIVRRIKLMKVTPESLAQDVAWHDAMSYEEELSSMDDQTFIRHYLEKYADKVDIAEEIRDMKEWEEACEEE